MQQKFISYPQDTSNGAWGTALLHVATQYPATIL